MKFEEVLRDITTLIDENLSSIREGHDIKVESVNIEKEIILVMTKSGKSKTRPFGELRKIWVELCTGKPVHVDSALKGSGSSRNQPETIFANLPYIEWLYLNGRKHLVLREEHSHSIGTLKKLDAISVEELKRKITEQGAAEQASGTTQIVIVSEDIAIHADVIERTAGVPGKLLAQGAYEYSIENQLLILVSTEIVPKSLPPGTYPILNKKCPTNSAVEVTFLNQKFHVVVNHGMALLFKIL
jgi:hypothetical protein